MSAIDEWAGGTLRVFLQWGPHRAMRTEYKPDEFLPLGGGWAIRRGRLGVSLKDFGVDGAVAVFEVRDDRLQCVAIAAEAATTDLTHTVLRRIASEIRAITRVAFETFVVRLVDVDGEIVGEVPHAKLSATKHAVNFGEIDEEVGKEFDRRDRPRGGRPPLPTNHLEQVAQAYRDAERLNQPKVQFIAEQFPGYSNETYRNWIRLARRRGLLAPFTRSRRAQ